MHLIKVNRDNACLDLFGSSVYMQLLCNSIFISLTDQLHISLLNVSLRSEIDQRQGMVELILNMFEHPIYYSNAHPW